MINFFSLQLLIMVVGEKSKNRAHAFLYHAPSYLSLIFLNGISTHPAAKAETPEIILNSYLPSSTNPVLPDKSYLQT